MRYFSITAWLIAMLLSSGCASDSTSDEESLNEVLNVDNLWQGSVPVEYQNVASSCRGGETSLLIPYSVSENSSFQIELYGCWMGSNLITCTPGEIFEEARIDIGSNKVNISLSKRDIEGEWECPAIPPEFGKFHTFEINGAWQRGELEIIVQNSDGDLTRFITME